MVRAAQQRVTEQAESKRLAERDWVAGNYPSASGSPGGVLTDRLATGQPPGGGSLRVRYVGRELRYVGDAIGRDGPPLDLLSFGSNETGLPAFVDPPAVFTIEPGKTKLNPGLDAVIGGMLPGERRVAIVPAALDMAAPDFICRRFPGNGDW
jgi:hypothetical protein